MATTHSVGAANVDTSTTGSKLARTATGREVVCGAHMNLRSGTAPDVALVWVQAVGGAAIRILQGTVDAQMIGRIALEPGDIIRWEVIAGGAGSTCDFTLSVLR